MANGNADSGAGKDFGKPDAGESHVRFDEGRLETGSGLGQPSLRSVSRDSAGPFTTTAPASYSTGPFVRRPRTVPKPPCLHADATSMQCSRGMVGALAAPLGLDQFE